MIVPAIGFVFCLLAVAIAMVANYSFRGEARLPMQWSITGKVNWTAPRVVGVSFFPIVTFFVLGLIWFASLKPTRLGQQGLVVPILLATGTTLIAIQLLHLWFASRTLRRDESDGGWDGNLT